MFTDKLRVLRELLAKATPGDWQIIVNKLPHHLGGEHTHRRIFTAWDHPQMKGPIPVVGTSIGIGPDKGGPCVQFTQIGEDDAELIVAMRATIDELLAIAEAAEDLRADAIEYEFEVWQDEAMQAGGTTTTLEAAIGEADHYAMMYGQDGPVEVRYYERRAISDAALSTVAPVREGE